MDNQLTPCLLSLRIKYQCGPERCVHCSVLPSADPLLPHLSTPGSGRDSRGSAGWCGQSGGAGSEEAGGNQYITGGCTQSGGEQTGTNWGHYAQVRITDLYSLHVGRGVRGLNKSQKHKQTGNLKSVLQFCTGEYKSNLSTDLPFFPQFACAMRNYSQFTK